MRTRIAPTPSGYLHVGNALNFLIVEQIARFFGAEIALRIDDIDRARIRDEYVEDLFDVLDWLEIEWSHGPRAASDLAEWSQYRRLDSYRKLRQELLESGLAYACSCSRSDWEGYTGRDCPRSCRRHGLEIQPGVTSVRVHLDGFDDPVIWRRDDLPAYHLTSIADDHHWGMGLVVRGEDLRESTDLQRRLSALLADNSFANCEVLHHPLVTHQGRKLSKSSGAGAVPMVRSRELRDDLRSRTTRSVAALLSAQPQNPGN